MQTEEQADVQGERIDAYLARVNPQFSRSYLQKLIKQGAVRRNNETLVASSKIHPGESLEVAWPDTSSMPVPDIEVLYEDDDVLVLNKPAGLLTHAKGAGTDEPTVADAVRHKTTAAVSSNRPGIVHRLDRDTSGVIITAKNQAAHTWLQKQFSQRKVKKTYIALVKGHPTASAAIIRLPIERNPKKPQTFRVGGNGKPAETAYETLHTYSDTTLLQFKPLTGRTHQLRVHAQYIHCPIVGDRIYGTPEPALGRMFLHASTLEITLPSRERKTFNAPLPKALHNYLNTLS